MMIPWMNIQSHVLPNYATNYVRHGANIPYDELCNNPVNL
jgi:hypothetical protein